MRSEGDLIPYSPGRLEGSPVLVLAPHPDDEVFGCGGAIVQLLGAGAEVRSVVLTDGGAQGDANTRRAEALEASARLGLDEPE
ncbi:MAG: PIG-L family deacetylase, partial [Acidobacteria bacterium]|nr:PIG-L family deacetylase [Candidatus Sulfomarinibacter kjeldsenii]